MLTVGRETNYLDPPELELEGTVNFEDPLERAAIALHRMTFATPPDVEGLLLGGPSREAGLAYTWTALHPSDRQLWRRRADTALRVVATAPAEAIAA